MLSTKRHRRDMGLSGDMSQMTGLALFIILLAFFIMLSSMEGVFLKKSDAVLASVRDAFGVPDILILDGSGRSSTKSALSRARQGTSLQDIAGAFQNEIPGIRAMLVRRSGLLQMDIPINEMNVLTGLSGDGSVSPAFQTLVAFLGDPTRLSYDVILQVNERPLFSERTAQYRSGVRSLYDIYILKWAAVLMTTGLPVERFHVGVGTGHPGMVTLMVRPSGREGDK